MTPEYAMRGYLIGKADVYSFGIVALEVVYGRCNTSHRPKEDSFYLLDWEECLMELVDSRLGSDFNKEEAMVMINVALLCTNISPAVRPTMSSVVSMLEGKAIVQELVSDPTATIDKTKHKTMRKEHQHSQAHNISENQKHSMSVDGQ